MKVPGSVAELEIFCHGSRTNQTKSDQARPDQNPHPSHNRRRVSHP
jgi:hypothetical protein